MRHNLATRLLAGASLAGLLVVATRCAGTDATPTQARSTASKLKPSGAISADLAAAAVRNGLLPHGQRSVNWMAEIHTAGMQDFMAQRAQLRGKGHAAECRGIEQMIHRQLPKIMAATGIRDDVFYQRAIAAALVSVHCAGVSPLSLWVAPLNLAVFQGEETVTGSYVQYTGQLEDAMLASYDPNDAAARMDAVVASATDLGSPDATVLAGIASLGASSAAYWYSVEQSGGGDGGGGGGSEGDAEPMSLFGMFSCAYWCQIGWHDLIGAVGGAGSVIYTTGGFAAAIPEAVLGGALVGGLAGSAANAF